MRHSHLRESLEKLNNSELLFSIRERRGYIRWHRDQKLDDRCWLDDLKLWEFLHDTLAHAGRIPSFEEGMRACREFYAHRRADEPDIVSTHAIMEKENGMRICAQCSTRN